MTDHPPERRSRERRKHAHPRDPVARCLIVLLAGIVALGAGWTAKNRSDYLKIQDGRRVGVIANCSIVVSIIGAGQNLIEQSVLLPGDKLVRGQFAPGPLTRLLGRAYPGYPERKARAKESSEAYQRTIAESVAKALRKAGEPNAPVTGGKLSCEKYAVVVKAR